MGVDQIEKALQLLKFKGPILPVQLVKELGMNTMFSGAILSQLVAEKKAHLTHAKIGSSPLYYSDGQEARMGDMIYKYLNEKDRKTFDLLRQNKILRDREQEPLTRVSLRTIKDFAVPLDVKLDGNSEIFWRWYLISDEEATELIRKHLQIDEKPVETLKTEIKEEKRIEEKPVEKAAKKVEEKIEKHLEHQEQIQMEEVHKIQEEKSDSVMVSAQDISDQFLSKIRKVFKEKDIDVMHTTMIKKNSEFDFILSIPSAVGKVSYYCKAKNKKRMNEADLTGAYAGGQLKKLPTLLITTGDFTKKANDLRLKDFNQMLLMKISGG